MKKNIIERVFVFRFLFELGIIMTMAFVGKKISVFLLGHGIPYGDWIGVTLGAIAVFLSFSVFYTWFDSVYRDIL